MLPQTITTAARRFGDRAAFRLASGASVTYLDLDRASDEAAAGLAARGLTEGDVLLLSLPSGPEYAVAYLAAAKVGAVTAGANPRLRARERDLVATTVGPALVLATEALAGGLSNDLTVELVTPTEDPGRMLGEIRLAGQGVGDLADDPGRAVCICFTSGSTGDPRGAWFTNRQLAAIAEMDTGGAWGSGGNLVAGTAFAHVGVMTKLPWQLASGATIHLMDRWDPGHLLSLLERHRLPAVNGVAAQIALLLRHRNFDAYDLSSIRAIVVGGGPSPPALVHEARRRFNAPYSIRYSSTESGGVGLGTSLDADDDEALHTVGRPRPGVEAEVRGVNGEVLDVGAVGEMWLRTPSAMSGYWGDPAGTATTLVDGWLRTGDLATVDPTGCHRLAGRVSEMFIRGGYNVYPLEVEAVLGTHPGIDQVAVVPRPDDVLGEVGVAVVVPTNPDEAPTLDQIIAHGRADLSSYKLPAAVRIVDRLPLNSGDKLDRRALAAGEAGQQADG